MASKKTGKASAPKMNIVSSSGASFTTSMLNPQSMFNQGISKVGSLNKSADYNVQQTSSFFYSPELTTESWLLPKSRAEILKWPALEDQPILCNGEMKKIGDVQIGDLVLSCTGKWQKVLDIQRKKADSKAVRLIVKYCPPVEMASYHPVLAIQANGHSRTLHDAIRFGLVNPKDKRIWVDADHLQEGDLIACPKITLNDNQLIDLYSSSFNGRCLSKFGKKVPIATTFSSHIQYLSRDVSYDMPRFLPMTESMFEFLGWYAAEGHISGKRKQDVESRTNSVTLSLCKDEQDVALRLKAILENELNIPENKIYIAPHNGHIRLIVSNSVLSEFLNQHFHTGSQIKIIPDWLLGADKSLILSFLRGWVKGDGSIREVTDSRTTFNVSTVSKNLAYKGHLLFNKVGIPVWFREKVQDLNYINKHSKIQMKSVAPVCYSLGVSGSSINKLFPGLHKNQKTETMFFEDDQYYYFPVTKVEIFDTKKDFCCVTTEDHTINLPFTTHNCRIFYNLEPYIQAITNLHAMYPFSKFTVSTPDKTVTKFYEDMCFNKDFDILNLLLQASISYNKFGEAIFFGNMEKQKDGLVSWKKFVLLEPELVEIKSDMISGDIAFELIPTEDLKALATSQKAEDQERKQKLQESSPEVFNAVAEKRNIQLDPENISYVARLTDPSATRGTSPIQACFKALILQDWIRLAQSAYAQRYVFPVELWTIGDLASNTIPDDATLEKFRNLINQSIQQPPFSLVFPPIVKYEPLGVMGKQFPLNNEYEYIQDQIMVAMGVNKNLLLGEGPSFSNVKTMALHALINRYKVDRDRFENWLMNKFFRPIAEKNNFYSTIDGKKELILPQLSWHKSLDVEEQEQEKQMLIELHGKGYVSTETLYGKFPSLDFKAEQKRLELEKGTIWDKGDQRLPGAISKSVVKKERSRKGPGGAVGAFPPIEPIRPMPPEEGGEVPGEEGMPIVPEVPAAPEAPTAVPEVPTTPAAPAE